VAGTKFQSEEGRTALDATAAVSSGMMPETCRNT
jgi:hypothetical protein